MKFNRCLIISAVLLSPAAYALACWFILDANNEMKTFYEMEPLYKNVLPLPGLSFTTQVYILLTLSVTGIVVLLNTGRSASFAQVVFRILLALVGLAETGLLIFSLL